MDYKDKFDLLIKEVEDKAIPALLHYAKGVGSWIHILGPENVKIYFMADNIEYAAYSNTRELGQNYNQKDLVRIHGNDYDILVLIIEEAKKYAKIDSYIEDCQKLEINIATRKILFEKINENG